MVPHYYNNILSRTVTATVDGDGATLLGPATPVNRGAVRICNLSDAVDVGLRAVTGTAPTMTSLDDADDVLGPRQSITLPYGKSISVYAINDTGAATTSSVSLVELG